MMFECQKCGKCCDSRNNYEHDADFEPIYGWELCKINRIAQSVGIPQIPLIPYNGFIAGNKVLVWKWKFEIESPCRFYNLNTGCKIQKYKPIMCAMYPYPNSIWVHEWGCINEKILCKRRSFNHRFYDEYDEYHFPKRKGIYNKQQKYQYLPEIVASAAVLLDCFNDIFDCLSYVKFHGSSIKLEDLMVDHIEEREYIDIFDAWKNVNTTPREFNTFLSDLQELSICNKDQLLLFTTKYYKCDQFGQFPLDEIIDIWDNVRVNACLSWEE